MKRVYKYLFVFLGSLFMFPLVSNAECSYERQAELSKIASNVGFSYTYEVDKQNTPQITAVINNITDDIYIEDGDGNVFRGQGEKTRKCANDETIMFRIYSNDLNCKGELILTKYLNIPYFNEYSNYPACVEHGEYSLCTPWANTKSISREDFDSLMFDYDTQQIKNDVANEKENNIYEFLKSYIQKNQILFTFVLVAIILLIVIVVYRFLRR